jgi:thiamine-phosphate pyrophosphorylase
VANAFLRGGARFLQLRAKTLGSGAFLELAARVVEAGHSAGAIVIINDRADIARLAGADGVHVGQDDLSPVSARAIVGDDAVVGVSTHDAEQRARALEAPVSYVAIGPVFGSVTKDTGYAAVGLEAVADTVRDAARRALRVVAIGGITLENAPSVIAAGAASVAVIGDLLATGDPETRVRQYIARLSR